MITEMQRCSVVFAVGVVFFTAAALLAGTARAEDAKPPELPKIPELPKGLVAPEVPVEYFVAVDGKQSGPFKCKELLKMANKHELTPESKVWKSGMPNWQRAGVMRDLDDIFAAVPPPVTDELLPVTIKEKPAATPCVPKPKKWWWPF